MTTDMINLEHLSLGYSRYAQRLLQAQPCLKEILDVAFTLAWTAEAMETRCQILCEQQGVTTGLRLLRAEVILRLMERDLRGLADLAEVTETMTLLAEITVKKALAWHTIQMRERYGLPLNAQGMVQDLLVVGMGKLGGRELNVSSDIDLIYLYEEEGMTTGSETSAPISHQEFFDRLAKQLTQCLSTINEYGFVFRVDLRLRPNGSAGFLVCSLAMLAEYFKAQGRDWERYAWIKGRLLPVSQSVPHCQPLLTTLVQGFVYRRYLDFEVVAALRVLYVKMHGYIPPRGGHDVVDIKRGVGGIRDIEFIAQTFQLIRAGQDYGLRQQATLAVLGQLARRELLSQNDVQTLVRAYTFLRTLEHRLQYLDDMQTHSMPNHDEDQKKLAQAMGYADYAALLLELNQVRSDVKKRFDALFLQKTNVLHSNQPSLWDRSMELSPTHVRAPSVDEDLLLPLLRSAQESTCYQQLTNINKQRFDSLMRSALDYTLHSAWRVQQREVLTTMTRFLSLLEAVTTHGSYLSLLLAYPQALVRVIELLATSAWAAHYLTSHPQLLDELLQEAQPEPHDYWQKFYADISARIDAAAGHSDVQMDILRHAQRAQTFKVLLRDLQGQLSVEHIADHLSALADNLLTLSINTLWSQMERRHCASPHFAIIAYGRLGGKELGYASDLDLVFLYDDAHEDALEIYANFARRLITWLTSHTAAGTLYDIDLRLRPNGDAGLLVTDIDAFYRYQLREGRNSAWVWEHQALVRARFCAGDGVLGDKFEAIRAQVLSQVRDRQTLCREILAMRERMHRAHLQSGGASDSFNLKHGHGGMVDIEFIVQYLVLLHSATYPQLLDNVGNIALLHRAAEVRLIDPLLADQVATAYRRLRALQHRQRLEQGDYRRVTQDEVAVERQAVIQLWETLLPYSQAISLH